MLLITVENSITPARTTQRPQANNKLYAVHAADSGVRVRKFSALSTCHLTAGAQSIKKNVAVAAVRSAARALSRVRNANVSACASALVVHSRSVYNNLSIL